MSLICLYLDRDNINYKLVDLFKEQNIDFLQYNLKNDKIHMDLYNINALPSMRFKDTLIDEVNEKSVETIIENFNNFVNSLPVVNISDKQIDTDDLYIDKKNIINMNSHKKFSNQILVNTLKINNKEKLIKCFKNFSKKHIKEK